MDPVDELYALRPDAFVPRRDELVRSARADGDRRLAAELKQLRRPSVGAWYLNLSVDEQLPALMEWLDFAAQLRASRDAALARRRPLLERRVLADVRTFLDDIGVEATAAGLDEVRAGLAATLVSADAAAAIGAGHLSRVPVAGSEDLISAMAAMAASAPRTLAGASEEERQSEIRARLRRRLIQRVADAEKSVATAHAALEGAERRRAELARALADAEVDVERAARAIERADEGLADARAALNETD